MLSMEEEKDKPFLPFPPITYFTKHRLSPGDRGTDSTLGERGTWPTHIVEMVILHASAK